MRNIIIVFWTLFIILNSNLNSLQADTGVTLKFRKASEFYVAKNYRAAASELEKLVGTGIESPAIFYNLGNCYYRLGKTAEPIYYYEKAAKLSPDDEDISNNLRIANLRTIDKYDEVPKFFLTAWFEGLRDSRTSDAWSLVSLILVWLSFALFAGFLLIRKTSLKKFFFALGTLILILFIGALILTYIKSDYEYNHKEAIVFSASAYVKSSPDTDGTDLFILHEGSKVEILEQVEHIQLWYKIRLPNGKTGWMLNSEARII